jgi:hypothetical protein
VCQRTETLGTPGAERVRGKAEPSTTSNSSDATMEAIAVTSFGVYW